jgi:hypothetical protein
MGTANHDAPYSAESFGPPYLVPLATKYISQLPILTQTQPVFFLPFQRPNFMPVYNNGQKYGSISFNSCAFR